MTRVLLSVLFAINILAGISTAQVNLEGSGERLSPSIDFLRLKSTWDAAPVAGILGYEAIFYVKIGYRIGPGGMEPIWDNVGSRRTTWVPGHFAGGAWVPSAWVGSISVGDAGGIRRLETSQLLVHCENGNLDADTLFNPNGVYEVYVDWHLLTVAGWSGIADFDSGAIVVDIPGSGPPSDDLGNND